MKRVYITFNDRMFLEGVGGMPNIDIAIPSQYKVLYIVFTYKFLYVKQLIYYFTV